MGLFMCDNLQSCNIGVYRVSAILKSCRSARSTASSNLSYKIYPGVSMTYGLKTLIK